MCGRLSVPDFNSPCDLGCAPRIDIGRFHYPDADEPIVMLTQNLRELRGAAITETFEEFGLNWSVIEKDPLLYHGGIHCTIPWLLPTELC